MLLWQPLSMLSEAFVVSQSDCYPIAKRIQKIVFSFVVLVADPKAFDLVDQVIARFTLVDCGLVEGVVGEFDALPVNVATNQDASLFPAHRSQFQINRCSSTIPPTSLLFLHR